MRNLGLYYGSKIYPLQDKDSVCLTDPYVSVGGTVLSTLSQHMVKNGKNQPALTSCCVPGMQVDANWTD